MKNFFPVDICVFLCTWEVKDMMEMKFILYLYLRRTVSRGGGAHWRGQLYGVDYFWKLAENIKCAISKAQRSFEDLFDTLEVLFFTNWDLEVEALEEVSLHLLAICS